MDVIGYEVLAGFGLLSRRDQVKLRIEGSVNQKVIAILFVLSRVHLGTLTAESFSKKEGNV